MKESKEVILGHLRESGAIAVVRMNGGHHVAPVVTALQAGGIRCIEITMTVPGAIEIIRMLVDEVDDEVIIGAGTVTRWEDAEAVIAAGAQFVVAPNLNLEVITTCNEQGVVVAPGCFSPTEILTAWNAGADLIKVFPANILGPEYFTNISGPLPHIPLMPTGGVTVDNAGKWIKAGAVAVAIGSNLLDEEAISQGQYYVLEKRAQRLVENILQAKRHISQFTFQTDGETA